MSTPRGRVRGADGGSDPSNDGDVTIEGFPEYHLADERRMLAGAVERAAISSEERRRIEALARRLVMASRERAREVGGIDAFMHEYGLTSEEGIILMCLAEALLRIPDADTADRLIADRIGSGQWEAHLGGSDSWFVNASTFALMLTGRLVRMKGFAGRSVAGLLERLLVESGEPVIRAALRQAMRILGDQFVLGRDIGEAIHRAGKWQAMGYTLSYDMLGEGARTEADAAAYLKRYLHAIEAIGKSAGAFTGTHVEELMRRPGMSVKLSAIHPRFEAGRIERLHDELVPRLVAVADAARGAGLSLTIDAEEQDRLEITLAMLAAAMAAPALTGWNGLGIAVQAYGKRALPALRHLRGLARRHGVRLPVRLVKGAYWDSEIKWAQERGLADYPVYTRKLATDVSYLACLRFLVSERATLYPQFATHNAHTVAAIHVMAGGSACEFQRLHGMGEALYGDVVGPEKLDRPCRIYAPVGTHEDLLAYLVRRLLENGANTSFVNRVADEQASVDDLIRDPVLEAEHELTETHGVERAPAIPRPPDLFGPERRNSAGSALSEAHVRNALLDAMAGELSEPFDVGPIVSGRIRLDGEGRRAIKSPHDLRLTVGSAIHATLEEVEHAITAAKAAQHAWNGRGAETRAGLLERAAGLYERDRARFIGVMVREAGKTLEAAQADLREAVDFLRFYAAEARRTLVAPRLLEGPTGERNELTLAGRGAFACIAPWNFPLAIFTGQVAAALAAGNSVLAKPAEQTPITAFLAVHALHEAGVPTDVLHLLPGGATVGAALTRDRRVAGIAFTGSNPTAWAIQKALADRRHAIVPLIAETGGINAMIADSSALPEQVVRDAVRSAFDSAGQRCSATRLLLLQDDIADRTIDMLAGATRLLAVGDPMDPATDIGPVIDQRAQDTLTAHKSRMAREGRMIVDSAIPEACRFGTFVAPAVYEIDRIERLEHEVFGPVLHVVRWQAGHLDRVVDALSDVGYGLTLGLHSRLPSVADQVAARARVGNLYVNRNQIGAVVGVQPFGGEGLSGTGPKAGGPHYLERFCTERVRSTDITATGGNVELLGLGQLAAGASDAAATRAEPAATTPRRPRRARGAHHRPSPARG